MFFDGWDDLLRVVVVGPLGYLALVAVLRVSGKRTLAKLNAFDFVITVALGSTLATILLSSTVALAEGVAALVLLVALQYAVAWSSVRCGPVRRAVRSEPTLVVHRGRMLPDAMRRERITEDEVLHVLRQLGQPALSQVSALVLETDGTFLPRPRSAGGRSPPAAVGVTAREAGGRTGRARRRPAGGARPPCPSSGRRARWRPVNSSTHA